MSNWNCIIQVFWVVLVTATAQPGRVKTSKACFDSAGRPCAQHKCNCKTDKIALVEAYFTNNTDCIQNENENCSEYKEQKGKYELTDTSLTSLYSTCSFRRNCSYGPIRKGSQIDFSVIKYECIDDKDILDMCNVSSHSGKQFTIAANSPSSRKCQCEIEREKRVNMPTITVNALQIQLGESGACSRLVMQTNVNKIEQNCSSKPIQNRTLVETTSPVHIELTTVKGPEHAFVWLQVLGISTENGLTTPFKMNAQPSNTGAVVGGVLSTVVVLVILTLFLVRFVRKRNQGSKPKTPLGQNCSLATPIPDHNYQEIEARETNKPGSNYDYATVDGGLTDTGNQQSPKAEDDYDHVGDKPSTNAGHYDTTLTVFSNGIGSAVNEDDYSYNHLGENGKRNNDKGVHSSGYDTAASASEAFQKFRTMGASDEDNYYGYNHIDKQSQPNNLNGEYDTTASAAKAVALMHEKNDHNEDDYDHFQQTKSEVQTSDSPYDVDEHKAKHTVEYSVAGAQHKHGRYDLTK